MKVTVVANKWWEVVPLVAILQHTNLRQRNHSASPTQIRRAYQPGICGISLAVPRLVAKCHTVDIEVWCIQDLIHPSHDSSSTWEKAQVIPTINEENGDDTVVVAFGTAASPRETNCNGNVVIGTSIFVHDPFDTPPDPNKHWAHSHLDRIVHSDFKDRFDEIDTDFKIEAEKRLLRSVNASADPPTISIGNNLVSVGVVNVTKSSDYSWTDKKAIEKFDSVAGATTSDSLETTHGVIRLTLNSPFIYVSGISNALGEFQGHVGHNPYAQTFVAAHNAAIALAWMIPQLV